jgi:hypothetical protein
MRHPSRTLGRSLTCATLPPRDDAAGAALRRPNERPEISMSSTPSSRSTSRRLADGEDTAAASLTGRHHRLVQEAAQSPRHRGPGRTSVLRRCPPCVRGLRPAPPDKDLARLASSARGAARLLQMMRYPR